VARHLPEHHKVRNIRNDSRVALSIESDKRNAVGLTEYCGASLGAQGRHSPLSA
jgi:hypothetical protein